MHIKSIIKEISDGILKEERWLIFQKKMKLDEFANKLSIGFAQSCWNNSEDYFCRWGNELFIRFLTDPTNLESKNKTHLRFLFETYLDFNVSQYLHSGYKESTHPLRKYPDSAIDKVLS